MSKQARPTVFIRNIGARAVRNSDVSTEEAQQATAEKQAQDNQQGRLALRRQVIYLTDQWLRFVAVITIVEQGLSVLGYQGLGDVRYVALVTTTTATVLGLWLVVGRGLYSKLDGN